jgi:FKBP-type peptidyl-prolyl cis-trans isomerase FkpA
MRTSLTSLVPAFVLALASFTVHAAEPTTEEEKTFYALGAALGTNLGEFNLTPAELEMVKAGINDTALKKPSKIEIATYYPKIQELHTQRMAAGAIEEKKKGDAFAAKAAAEKGATKTPSGLVIKTVKAGTGPSPKVTDTVKVHYHGTLIDGTVFDSSVQRNEPATFPLNGVIKCWTEGVAMMKVGGKSRLVCPADIAYGDRGHPPQIKPGATLVFDVDLLAIEPAAPEAK